MPPKASVVIPALNEEKYLPIILGSLKKQTMKNFEVIVSDAGSTDKTAEVARSFNAKVVRSSKKPQSFTRNAGAKKAKGDILFFLDADLDVPRDFLEKATKEFESRGLDIASCMSDPSNRELRFVITHKLANMAMWLVQHVKPMAPGYCIIIKRSIHEKIWGFDEKLHFGDGEDVKYVSDASKKGRFKMLKSTRVINSTRRMESMGAIGYIIWSFHNILLSWFKPRGLFKGISFYKGKEKDY